jgi:hypothetical protein
VRAAAAELRPALGARSLLPAARTARRQAAARVTVKPSRCVMIRKLKSGEYRLYSVKKDAKTGRRRNLGTFSTLEAAKQHEREVQFFKRH